MKKLCILFLLIISSSVFADQVIWDVKNPPGDGWRCYVLFTLKDEGTVHISGSNYYYSDLDNNAQYTINFSDDIIGDWDAYWLNWSRNDGQLKTLFDPGGAWTVTLNILYNNSKFYFELWRDPLFADPYIYASTSFALIKDNTPPALSLEIVPPDVAGLIGGAGYNGWYNKGPLTIKIHPTDNGAGYYATRYSIDKRDTTWPATTGTEISMTEEGQHTIYFQAWDYVNNYSTEYSITTKLDWSAPDAVTGFITSVESTDNTYGAVFTSLRLNWNKVTHDAGGSGVNSYELAWKRSDTAFSPDKPTYTSFIKIDDLNANTTSYAVPLAELERGVFYDFAVRAVDLVENAGSWSAVTNVFIPPEIKILDVTHLAPIMDAGGEPLYKTVITLNRGKEVIPHINGINILAGDTLVSGGNKALLLNIDEDGNPLYPWGVDGNGNLTFTSEYAGVQYAHRAFTYHVYTEHSAALGNFVEYGSTLPDPATAEQPEPLLNYPVQFVVEVKDTPGNVLKRIDENGFDADTQAALVEIYKKEKLFFQLLPRTGGITDIENDTLYFRLKDINGVELSDWTPAGTAIEFFPFQEGKEYGKAYMCYIEVSEYTTNVTGSVQPLAEIYGTGYINPRTLHTAPTGEQEGFYVYFDFAQPAGIFTIKHQAEDITYSVERPAINRDVRFYMRPGALTDETGPIDSGITGGIKVWNVDPGSLVSIEFLTEESIPGTKPADSALITRIPMEVMPGDASPEVNFYPWLLAEGADGYRIAAMEVQDRAGNFHYAFSVLWLDTTPPEALDINSFHYTATTGNLVIKWAALPDPGIKQYRIRYDAGNDGTMDNLFVENPAGQPAVIISTGNYGADTKIPVYASAIDRAGHESQVTVFEPYTLAEPGSLSSFVKGKTAESGYYLTCTLSGGKAARQVLAVLDADLEPTGVEIEAVGNTFTHAGLERGKTYNYCLLAYNSYIPKPGEKAISTTGAFVSMDLMNIAPQPATGLQPDGFSPVTGKFQWQAAYDADGDQLAYHVYIKKNGAGEFTLLETVEVTECIYPPELFTDGDTCQWYVIADDTGINGTLYGETAASAISSFVVDGIAPVVNVERPGGLYTNAAVMSFTITETNALAGVFYRTTIPGMEEQTVDVTADGNGQYSGSVNLVEYDTAYTVTVEVMDKAGNTSKEDVTDLRVDHTAPVAGEVSFILDELNGELCTGSSRVPVEIALADNHSGIRTLEYAFMETGANIPEVWTNLQLEYNASLLDPALDKSYNRVLTLNGDDGKYYSLVARAIDWAGNTGEPVTIPGRILLDTSPPEAALEATGFSSWGGGFYTSRLDTLTVNLNYADNHSGITAIHYTIAAVNEEPGTWYDSFADIPGQGMVNGTRYRILAKAVNGTGLESTISSDTFVFDNTSPVDLALIFAADPVTPGQEFRLAAGAKEPDSAIAEYRLAIGTAENSTLVSAAINGNTGGWMVAKSSSESYLYNFRIPGLADGTYTVRLEVLNASGLVSTKADSYITIDSSSNRMLVWDTGPFSPGTDRLSGRWQFYSPDPLLLEQVTGYEYRITGPGGAETDWVFTTQDEYTVENLNLTPGSTYQFEARAVFEDQAGTSSYSETGSSAGVTIDNTAPLFAAEDGLITPAVTCSDRLKLSWQVSDQESGIASVAALLEAYDASIKYSVSNGWISLVQSATGADIYLNTDAAGNPLELLSGQRIYLTLRVINYAGLISERAAPVIIIDNTAPPVPLVIDQGDVINNQQFPCAYWTWSETDPESGAVTYTWTLVQEPGEEANASWYADDGSHTADAADAAGSRFTALHGSTWYFAVRAENRAGLTSTGYSNGIILDETAPFIASVKLLSGAAEPGVPDMNYITRTEGLQLFIDAYEDFSEMEYSAVYGKLDDNLCWQQKEGTGEYTATTTPLALENPQPQIQPGEIVVFKGVVDNRAGLTEAGYTQGVKLDTSAPVITYVNGYVSGDLLFFDWDVASPVPIVRFEVALVRAGSQQLTWQSTGLEKNLVINRNEQSLANGKYVLYVKAENAAGTVSQIPGLSNIVILDNTPPEIKQFRCPAYAAESIAYYIEAEEGIDESGIAEYQYAFGTFENSEQFTTGWVSLFHKTGTLNGIVPFDGLPVGSTGINHNTYVYLSVRVKNEAGLWSTIMRSDPILIDKTRAVVSGVTASPYTTAAESISGIGFTITDTESGLLSYQAAAVPDLTPATLQAAAWQTTMLSQGTGKIESCTAGSVKLDALNLMHGGTYYIVIRAENGAGTWSGAIAGNPVRVDLAPPALLFDEGDKEITVNGESYAVGYTLVEDVSAQVQVTFTLSHPQSGWQFQYAQAPVVPGHYTFLFNRSEYGRYELTAVVQDSAGNSNTVAAVQYLRVNAPPQITMEPVLVTNPGREIQFSVTYVNPGNAPLVQQSDPIICRVYVYDPDGEEDLPCSVMWDFYSNGTPVSEEGTPVFSYQHADPFDPLTTYTLSFTARDRGGKAATVSTQVRVINTQQGTLHADEYWSVFVDTAEEMFPHRITGDIVIPAGRTLTILPAAVIEAGEGSPGDFKHSITVEPLGRLEATQGATFRMEEGLPETWEGITVAGNAQFNQVTIADARWGLNVTGNPDVTISGCLFMNNEYGVHVNGVNQVIANTAFTNNRIYAIKEDGGAVPQVNHCTFNGNLHDYYHQEITTITGNELNELADRPLNSGNTSDKVEVE